jgi:hypothetical protein
MPTQLAQNHDEADHARRRHQHAVPVRRAGERRSVSGQQQHQSDADRERRQPVTRRRPAALLARGKRKDEQQLRRHQRLDRRHRPDLERRRLGSDAT